MNKDAFFDKHRADAFSSSYVAFKSNRLTQLYWGMIRGERICYSHTNGYISYVNKCKS